MLRWFRSDQRGVAAVEFALIAPAMILLYCGMAELTLTLMAGRRASHAVSVVGDLVAQSSTINGTQMTDIFKVADAVVAPFPTTGLKMRVSSVTANAGGVPQVVWSQGKGMTALGVGTTAAAVPANLMLAGDNVVVAEMSYAYTPPLGYFMKTGHTFTKTFLLRPRRAPQVAWTAG
ncbi:MAG: TadE/TadG family type IV pilus assembly protein [Phenylobacterium sp.]